LYILHLNPALMFVQNSSLKEMIGKGISILLKPCPLDIFITILPTMFLYSYKIVTISKLGLSVSTCIHYFPVLLDRGYKTLSFLDFPLFYSANQDLLFVQK